MNSTDRIRKDPKERATIITTITTNRNNNKPRLTEI